MQYVMCLFLLFVINSSRTPQPKINRTSCDDLETTVRSPSQIVVEQNRAILCKTARHDTNGCFLKNNGTPKSSILIGFSIIHLGGNPPIFGNIQMMEFKIPIVSISADSCRILVALKLFFDHFFWSTYSDLTQTDPKSSWWFGVSTD